MTKYTVFLLPVLIYLMGLLGSSFQTFDYCQVPLIRRSIIRHNGKVVERYSRIDKEGTINISCSDGFIVKNGPDFAVCRNNGTWLLKNGSVEVNLFGKCTRDTSKDRECGLTSAITPFVYGGKAAMRGELPWMVRLDINGIQSASKRCGGSLVTENWVLTAAHCFEPFNQAISVNVHLGRTNFSDLSENSSGQQRSVQSHQIVMHPKWNSTTFNYDFALLRLNYPATLNQYVRKICLPDEPTQRCSPRRSKRLRRRRRAHSNGFFPRKIDQCSKPWAAGWGEVPGKTGSQSLLKVNLTIYRETSCQTFRKPHRSKFCAGSQTPGYDTCRGDSGGPLFCKGRNDRYYAVGVVSYSEGNCGDHNKPGVYSRICKALSWIRNVTSNVSLNPTTTIAVTTKKVECPRRTPRVSNGMLVGRGRVVGANRRIRCNNGYSRVGRKQITCRRNGRWSLPGSCRLRQTTTLSTTLSAGEMQDQLDQDLFDAVLSGELSKARQLIRAGATNNYKNGTGYTALHEAAFRDHYQLVRALLRLDSTQVDVTDYDKHTPLMTASFHGNLRSVELLVANGANVNATDRGWKTPLILSIYSGNLQVVQFLIDSGADVNARSMVYGSALELAALLGAKLEIVKALVENGADVTTLAISFATIKKVPGVVEYLRSWLSQ